MQLISGLEAAWSSLIVSSNVPLAPFFLRRQCSAFTRPTAPPARACVCVCVCVCVHACLCSLLGNTQWCLPAGEHRGTERTYMSPGGDLWTRVNIIHCFKMRELMRLGEMEQFCQGHQLTQVKWVSDSGPVYLDSDHFNFHTMGRWTN